MKKVSNILISFITSLFMTTIYLPVKISGGLANTTSYNVRTNGLSLLFDKFDKDTCWDCFNYKVRWNVLIVQIIITFVVILLILNLIDKRRKNNE